MTKAKGWGMLFAVLALIGALNWATVGLLDFNILYWLFGLGTAFSDSTVAGISRTLEFVAGVSGVYFFWEKVF